MITKYNSFLIGENAKFDTIVYESIENNKFNICFYFSKLAKGRFTLKYTIHFYNIKILKNSGMKEYLTKSISDILLNSIFKNKFLYKHSTNEYVFDTKSMTYILLFLQLINYPKGDSFYLSTRTKQRLEDILTSNYNGIDKDCYTFLKEYDNVNLLKDDFKKYSDDMDYFVEKMLILNDKFYLNNLFKIIMNDDIKKKYRYFDDAKNFDLL